MSAEDPYGVPCGYVPRAQADSPALEKQVSGTHYKKHAIQPVEYIHANGIGFCEGSAIKYLTRWRDKGGVADLDKAIHFIELLKELEARKTQGEVDKVFEAAQTKPLTFPEIPVYERSGVGGYKPGNPFNEKF